MTSIPSELDRLDARHRGLAKYPSMVVTAAAWTYALTIPIVLRYGGLEPLRARFIEEWLSLPSQLLATGFCAWLLYQRRVAGKKRMTCGLFLAYGALSIAALFAWNIFRNSTNHEEFGVPDALNMLAYWVFITALANLFRRAGGSFRSRRVWLDAVTMIAVQLVALWSFALTSPTAHGLGYGISIIATVAYSITLAVLMTTAALLCLQLPRFRGRQGVLLLVAAVGCTCAWDMNWLANWLIDQRFIDVYYNYGDVLSFSCIISAIAATQFQAALKPETVNPERQAFSFLPALAVLLLIALVACTLAMSQRTETWVLVGLVVLCAQLLITRQAAMRKELRDINRCLATREAEARLTELVRRSRDLILVVDAQGDIRFASPAAEAMVGKTADWLSGTPAARLFGPEHEHAMQMLLEHSRAGTPTTEELELKVGHAPMGRQDFTIGTFNQLDNPLINGIVLTVREVTAQRALEREILDVANRERIRLCADIHDGLGQDLTGIALLLQAAAVGPHANSPRQCEDLHAIVEHVNRTIDAARDLARGYSPLQVVGGSLRAALAKLVQEALPSMSASLWIDPHFDERLIGEFTADHLYRIVQEAIANAVRHSGGRRVEVSLRCTGASYVVAIRDDGSGIERTAGRKTGVGLRLMEYRAGLIGGALRTDSSHRGTLIEAAIPMTVDVPGETPMEGYTSGYLTAGMIDSPVKNLSPLQDLG